MIWRMTKEQVEAYVLWLHDILLHLWISTTMKSYDPLTIEEVEWWYIAHTYVYDMIDWGRHHPRETLEEIKKEILDETLEEIKYFYTDIGYD